MSTPHNSATKGQFAKSVLMPGDPLRAKFIAANFLKDAKLVNNVRGIGGYTGTWKGKAVSVMASGMGMPSIGIYSYELYKQYDVENIIRIGSAGSYVPELKIFDVVLASAAYSESSYAKVQSGYEDCYGYPSKELNEKIKKAAQKLNIPLTEGVIHSSDVFYHEKANDFKQLAHDKHCICVEMESFALFNNARVLGKKAACLLTISDSLISHEETSPKERQLSFTKMIEIALDAAIL